MKGYLNNHTIIRFPANHLFLLSEADKGVNGLSYFFFVFCSTRSKVDFLTVPVRDWIQSSSSDF